LEIALFSFLEIGDSGYFVPKRDLHMLSTAEKISEKISAFNNWVGHKTAWLTVALVILFCYDVLMRYAFNHTKVWIGELEWHLFSLIFLFGAAYTLDHDRHVRVDLFYDKFSKKKKAWVDFAGTLLLLLPWCVVILVNSIIYAGHAFQQMEGSPNPGGLPYRFIIKSAISAGFLLLLLQALSILIKTGLEIFTSKNPEQKPG